MEKINIDLKLEDDKINWNVKDDIPFNDACLKGDATAGDIKSGKIAYVKGEKITGTMNLALEMIKNCKYRTHLFDHRSCLANLLNEVGYDTRVEIGTFEYQESNTASLELQYLFYYCSDLVKLPKLKLGTTVRYNGDSHLGPSYDFLFSYCKNLETLDVEFSTYKGKSHNYGCFRSTFEGCNKLKEITLNDIRIGQGYAMFMFDNQLETIRGKLSIISYWNESVNSMFEQCSALKNVQFETIEQNLQLGSGTNWGHLLTLESLLSAIQACYKMNSSRTLTVGTANLEKLASVYVKVTDDSDTHHYPFEVCESTDENALTIEQYMALKNWKVA